MVLTALITAVFFGAWPISTVACSPVCNWREPCSLVKSTWPSSRVNSIPPLVLTTRTNSVPRMARRRTAFGTGFLRFVAVEEVGRAGLDINDIVVPGLLRRLDFQGRQFIEAKDAFVRHPQSGAAGFAAADLVAQMEDLIGLAGGKSGRAGRSHLHGAGNVRRTASRGPGRRRDGGLRTEGEAAVRTARHRVPPMFAGIEESWQ